MAREAVRILFQMQNFLLNVWNWIASVFQSVWLALTAQRIDFGTYNIRMGRQIAQGGFSYVFEAKDSQNQRYALKRIHVADAEIGALCQAEARVHRSVQHEHVLELLGMTFVEHNCYMLFHLYDSSLRDEINTRLFNNKKTPFSNFSLVKLIHGITSGLQALHQAGYSHRDVKPENVLLTTQQAPVLMDLGSAGTRSCKLSSKREINMAVETAATHTTLPYRPPELLEAGNLRPGDVLDYTAVDVWSLGCLMFAALFGSSPKECEFRNDQVRIVPCTQLSILQDQVPWPSTSGYPKCWHDLIRDCLAHDRNQRPTLDQILQRLDDFPRGGGGSSSSFATSRFRDSFNEDV